MLRVLKQEAYVTGGLSVTVNGERITHEKAIEPIISRVQRDRVRRALEGRQCRPGVRWTTKEALLRGLAVCGCCGASIHVQSDGQGRNLGRRYYRCSSSHASSGRKPCGLEYHRLERTDDAVWTAIVEALSDSSWLAKAAGAPKADDASWERQAAQCRKRIKLLQRSEVEAVRSHRRGDLSDAAFSIAMREGRTERETVERSLALAEETMSRTGSAAAALETLTQRVAALGGNLQSCNFAARRRIVEALVPRGDGFGFYLYDGARVEVHGVLDVSEGRTGKVINETPAPARRCRAAR